MITPSNYISDIKRILSSARQKAYSAINTAMVEAYWQIGKRIVDEEQNGEKRAEYGQEILKTLSYELTAEFGKGFSLTNLKNFKRFYLIFNTNEKSQTVSDQLPFSISQTGSAKLSWSHYERLIRVENKEALDYYLKEISEHNWSVRTLDRNISTLYYQRLLSSQIKEPVENEREKLIIQQQLQKH
jgi:hypothetical protein